jgi:hypothetical protein
MNLKNYKLFHIVTFVIISSNYCFSEESSQLKEKKEVLNRLREAHNITVQKLQQAFNSKNKEEIYKYQAAVSNENDDIIKYEDDVFYLTNHEMIDEMGSLMVKLDNNKNYQNKIKQQNQQLFSMFQSAANSTINKSDRSFILGDIPEGADDEIREIFIRFIANEKKIVAKNPQITQREIKSSTLQALTHAKAKAQKESDISELKKMAASVKKINLGTDGKDEVMEKIGQPSSTSSDQNYTLFSYKIYSDSQNLRTQMNEYQSNHVVVDVYFNNLSKVVFVSVVKVDPVQNIRELVFSAGSKPQDFTLP